MRVERLQVGRFGPLAQWDTGEAPLPGMVVIEGPNEAGKSSIHALLTALFFGIYPTSRDTNPWSPWGGGDIEIVARYRSSTGEEAEVRRRLLSAPQGERVIGATSEPLANRSLPEVQHVSQKIFEEVYALRLSDLAGLGTEGRAAIEDRLVIGMGATDLRPPRKVVDDLVAEARRLWIPTRHQTTRHAQLQATLSELRDERRAASARDGEVRSELKRIEVLDAELERVRQARAVADRRQELRPLAQRLGRIRELERRVGEPSELEGLPVDPMGRLGELETAVQTLRSDRDELEEEQARARARAAEEGEDARRLLPHAQRIQALVTDLPALSLRAETRIRLEEEVGGLTSRVEEQVAPLVQGGEGSISPGPFLEVPLPELAERVRTLEATEVKRAGAEEALRGTRERVVPTGPALGIVVAGVLGVVVGVVLALTIDPQWAGGLVGLLGVGLLLRWWGDRSAFQRAAASRNQEVGKAQARVEELVAHVSREGDRVRELLAPLPLRPELVTSPSSVLVSELQSLVALLRQRADRVKLRTKAEQEWDRVERELESLRQSGAPIPAGSPLKVILELQRRMTTVTTEEAERKAALSQAADLEEALGKLRPRLAVLEADQSALTTRIEAAGGSGLPERLEARRRLELAREDLADAAPDMDGLMARLDALDRESPGWADAPADNGDGGTPSSAELREREGELREEIAGLREGIRGKLALPTPDLIEGEIQAVEAEMAMVRRERDRLFLLQRTLEVAERRFREKHQPDLLQSAEGYLARITGGRYDRLLVADGGTDFHLRVPELGRELPVNPPLSTGTREQVYLALRLAIVDHLDEGRERLPLFLDEVLVNWDPARRAQGLALFSELSSERQIFLFTCHPELAREAERAGARRLTLEGPSTRSP